MATPATGSASATLLEAQQHLDAARWPAARAAFERAIAARAGAEALEGLSWAAWWLDDAAAVFDARERAYRGYRDRGDARGAARTATWLACDELDFRGASAVAEGWLARARRLLEAVPPAAEHGWLAFFDGFLAHAAGDTPGAAAHARRAAALGRELGVPDVHMLGLALEGAALVASGRVPEGMRLLDEGTAAATAGDAAIPIASAWTCCFLVTACVAVRDFGRAAAWCDRIAAFAERYGSRYMLAFCRAEYGAVDVWAGRWRQAEALLEASVEDFARSRPAMVGAPLVTLAELRRRQGRPQDAAPLLDRAGASPDAQVCRGRLALDRGEPGPAGELADRVLRQIPADRGLDRVAALDLVVHARTRAGEPRAAARALDELRGIAGRAGTVALRACADAAAGAHAAALGDHARAKPLLEDAVDGFARGGGPFEACEARVRLAATLAALGRHADARAEVDAAADGFLALGAAREAQRARHLLPGPAQDALAATMTPRERDVLRLLARGLTNQEIAGVLVVSEHTVHRHVANILRKLDAPTRAAAAAEAVRAGLAE